MKKLLVIISAAGLIMFPFAALSEDYRSQPSGKQQTPPVAQTLVREGDFAIKLAARFGLGSPAEETDAEALLSEAGVVPLNGWLSDYPVTPEIVGQLQGAAAKAAAEGKLPMSADEATRGLYALAAEESLPTPAGPGSPPGDGQNASTTAQSNPAAINNYYYDQGPPIISYYPPPVDYLYLYDWVPYPAWWFGFWFPGFYICHTFATVVVSGPVIEHRFGRRHLVTNHVFDPVTRTRVLVSPVTVAGNGHVRSMTTLRAESGERFRTLEDVRQHSGMAGLRDVAPGSGRDAGRSTRSIYPRQTQDGVRFNRGPDSSMARGDRSQYTAPRLNERMYRPPRMNKGEGSFPASPGARDRSERQFNAPAGNGEHGSVAPGRSSRATDVSRGRSGSDGAAFGNARQGREGGGREGSGSMCRGRWC